MVVSFFPIIPLIEAMNKGINLQKLINLQYGFNFAAHIIDYIVDIIITATVTQNLH